MTEIDAANARVREGERASARRVALEGQIKQEQSQLDRLQEDVDASEHRVKDLEGHTLAHVIAALRRSRGEEIDAASAGVRAAQLELATRQSALETVRADYDAARAREGELDADRHALQEARTRREAAITSSGGPEAARMKSLSDRRSTLMGESNASKEALSAANDAAGALAACGHSFASAGSWSTYDTFFGGGMIADHIQNNRLNDAAQAASAAQAALHRLAADVQGLNDSLSLELPKISDGLKTFDMWLGGFFTDLTFHNKIRASQESVSAMQSQVEQLASDLASHSEAIDSELSKTNAEYETLLTSS